MNSNQITKQKDLVVMGNWESQSKLLEQKFSELRDSELKLELDKENDLLNKVENTLNKKREEVISIINKKNQTSDRVKYLNALWNLQK